MFKYEKRSPEYIMNHQCMRKPDGSTHQIKTIKLWIKRLEATGEMKSKPKCGRPKKLNDQQAIDLVNFIKNHPKLRYSEVKRETGVEVSPRTINRIANEHGLSNFIMILLFLIF